MNLTAENYELLAGSFLALHINNCLQVPWRANAVIMSKACGAYLVRPQCPNKSSVNCM